MNDAVVIPFVDLSEQHASLAPELEEAIRTVVERGDFILGEDVERFEEEFAGFCGTEHAIGVDSGSSALELILRACDIGPGHEVIVPANTFIASALAISYAGARPVLVDVDQDTYTLDPALLERAITNRTKAVMPVHLYGQVADMDPIQEVARRHGLRVIEDACQAHGAMYRGRRAGTLGDAAAFSFYPSKNLGAFGDAGAIVTDDPQIARRVRLLRNYGSNRKYHHDVLGFNRRLDTLHASVLRVKLRHLEMWNERRRRIATVYDAALEHAPVHRPFVRSDGTAVYHLYVIRSHERDALQARLQERGIGTGVHYPIPIHLQPAYRYLQYDKGSFPIAELHARQILSLPMFPELSLEAAATVARAVVAASVPIHDSAAVAATGKG